MTEPVVLSRYSFGQFTHHTQKKRDTHSHTRAVSRKAILLGEIGSLSHISLPQVEADAKASDVVVIVINKVDVDLIGSRWGDARNIDFVLVVDLPRARRQIGSLSPVDCVAVQLNAIEENGDGHLSAVVDLLIDVAADVKLDWLSLLGRIRRVGHVLKIKIRW